MLWDGAKDGGKRPISVSRWLPGQRRDCPAREAAYALDKVVVAGAAGRAGDCGGGLDFVCAGCDGAAAGDREVKLDH